MLTHDEDSARPPRRVLGLCLLDPLSADELMQLATWAQRFSPLVQPLAPSMLLLDLTGSRRLFGGNRGHAGQMRLFADEPRMDGGSGRSGEAVEALFERPNAAGSRMQSRTMMSRCAVQSDPFAGDAIDARIAGQAILGLERQGLRALAVVADTIGTVVALAAQMRSSLSFPEAASTPPTSLSPSQPLSPEKRGTPPARRRDARVRVVPHGQASAFLAPLPPALLRIDEKTIEQLGALGIRSIGDLLMLPRSTLPSRFGRHLILRIQQALGEVYEPLTPHVAEPPPQSAIAFDGAVRDAQVIQSAAIALVDDLLAQVARQEAALRRLDCVLLSEDAPPEVLPISLSRGSRSAAHVRDLLSQRLESALPRAGRARSSAGRARAHGFELLPDEDFSLPGFTGVRLIAAEITRWRGGQGELFDPYEPGNDELLGGLVDRLSNRLGTDAIVRAALVDDYQPERAYCYVPFLAAAATARSADVSMLAQRTSDSRDALSGIAPAACAAPRVSLPPAIASRPPRPMRMLPRPQPVRVTLEQPSGAPARVYYDGCEHAVRLVVGPERIETGWWRGADVRRDYFRVTLESGEKLWIFYTPLSQAWYLHGMFE